MRSRPAGLSRRVVVGSLGTAAVCLLAGCTETQTFPKHFRLLNETLFHKSRTPLTRDEVAKFQAASISLQVGRNTPALVLLSSIQGRDFVWRVNKRVIVATRGARLVATGGLLHNLERTDLISPDPVDGKLLSADGASCTRLLSLSDDYGNGITARSQFEIGRQETLTIIGSRIPTLRIIEHVRVPRLRWRHRNIYWAHAKTGDVWKSRQHFHPDSAPLTITTLRPARKV